MSVSHRVTGTWAELTADGSVTIPSTPQAGDRMYLFARWKDFSVTATVANWTELEEFADGSVTSGNGTGSVKVACWYRDWQSGDANPTIDFSASPTNASVVITVMSKGADDVWELPVARTAAMTNWTTTSQSVSASATTTVPSSGVVLGLIGLRDDSAVMTRPTNGIDDSGGLVTWNGNYVESPATHHSTTTGDDGAADLGYRLVSTGAAGATLRMTGTISAAETGAALWVVQGVSVLITPASAALTSSQFAPQLQFALVPVNASLATTGFAPQLRLALTPASVTLSMVQFAPALTLRITPAAQTLTVTLFAPQLRESLTPPSASLSIATFAPAFSLGLTPATVMLTLSTFAPGILQNVLVTVPNASLSLTTSTPHVLPFRILYLDPGGDAVQVTGYFNVAGGAGSVSFDTAQKVVGVGSWKCDSGAGNQIATLAVNGVLGPARRGSFYFRYNSAPETGGTVSEFGPSHSVYSGGGFTDDFNMNGEGEGVGYGTASPSRNAGQGTVFTAFNLGIPIGAFIDSVKIIYERKYDTADSIGISRVKWRVNGEEGPNHDNTSEPLTDTVVEVDVTGDRFWEPQDFGVGFEIIAEARRGDTDTAHTQSWDYVKVTVSYHTAVGIWQVNDSSNSLLFQLAILTSSGGVRLRCTDGGANSYDGITDLAPDTWHRIGYAYNIGDNPPDDLSVSVYVGSIRELSLEDASTGGLFQPANIRYGWNNFPGANKVCWFDQIPLDDGDDLSDLGNLLMTSKLPATVNDDNFDTTGGTGAVNERPPNLDNYRAQVATAQVNQNYTLQAASVGDVDISGESVVGYMGWVIAKKVGPLGGTFQLTVNGVNANLSLTTTPAFHRRAVTDASYPSNAAGIGMVSATTSHDTYLYEGGMVVAHEGPANPDILLARQELANETLDTIIDDLRADPPDSYEICCEVQEFDGQVTIDVYSLDQEGGSLQHQGTLNSSGGVARLRITAGIEVRLDVTVSGVTMMQVYRRLNVD